MVTETENGKKEAKTIKRETSLTDAAEILDVHPKTLQGWVNSKGAPHDKRGRRFFVNVPELAAWMRAEGISGAVGRPASPEAAGVATWRERKEKALCLRYEFELDLAKKKFMPVEEYWRRTHQHVRIVIAHFDAMPAMAMELVGRDELEIAEKLRRAVRELRAALAGPADRADRPETDPWAPPDPDDDTD